MNNIGSLFSQKHSNFVILQWEFSRAQAEKKMDLNITGFAEERNDMNYSGVFLSENR